MTDSSDKAVRVRFAPSPTGPFHVGGARTALFNWLFARAHKGSFVLRIEDTDKDRSEKEYESQIFDSLSWLGMDWDEGPDKGGEFGPYRQSERTEIYKKYLERLLEEGRAYYCYCTKEELEEYKNVMMAQGMPPKYGGHCRNFENPPTGKTPQVIRFKTPEVRVEFKDLIRGTVSFDAALFGDISIAKDLETPLYNFAVAIDDYEMKITHVIRGEDHISNTPKQILISKALSFPDVKFAHLPLILAKDRSKLSKRFVDVSLLAYRSGGFLPQALVNFLALLGWHPEGDKEVFDINELVKEFDIKRAQKGGAIFNEEKLSWLNAQHIQKLPEEELIKEIQLVDERLKDLNEDILKKSLRAVRERMKKTSEFWELASLFFELPEYESELLVWQKSDKKNAHEILQKIRESLDKLSDQSMNSEVLLELLDEIVTQYGRGPVFWPLRVSVSGKAASPDPLIIMEILGKDESLRRIDIAINKLHD